MTALPQRRIGDVEVGAVGLGGMPMSIEGRPDESRSIATVLQFSPRFRSSEPELVLCDEMDIAFLPWSPLGGISNAAELGSRHAAFAEVATELGVSPQQVTLAWMLAKSPRVIPIPGSSRPETIRDSVAATTLNLTPDHLTRLA